MLAWTLERFRAACYPIDVPTEVGFGPRQVVAMIPAHTRGGHHMPPHLDVCLTCGLTAVRWHR